MTIRVVTAHYRSLDGYFIGRPSLLASPFNIGLQGKRMAVIEKYRIWLWEKIMKQDLIVTYDFNRLGGKTTKHSQYKLIQLPHFKLN